MKRLLRCLPITLLALLILCLAVTGILALDARSYTSFRPDTSDRLDGRSAGYIEEAFHLRSTLGDSAWPGFGKFDIPMLVGNDAEIFLVGTGSAPEGWEALPASIINNQPVFRRPAGSLGGKLQAFVTLLDGRWLPSFYTYAASSTDLLRGMAGSLPAPLPALFPYRLFLNFFYPPQVYILSWQHEAFHAFEAQEAPERFAVIDSTYSIGKSYPLTDPAFNQAWEQEADLLVRAVQAKSDQQARELAVQFLDQRRRRRQASTLSPALIQFECDAEWLEGLAKYTELTIGKQASEAPGYKPAEGIGFTKYSSQGWRYTQQVTEVRNHLAGPDDDRFYYTGFLQALILDRLQPSWKEGFLEGGGWLEDRLAQATH